MIRRQQPSLPKMRSVFNWIGLIGGVLVGGIFLLVGNVLIGFGAGLGFAAYSVGAGWISAHRGGRLMPLWIGIFIAVIGGLAMASDHAATPVSAAYALAVGGSFCLGVIWSGLLGPIDQKAIALLTGERQRRQVHLRRWWFLNLVLAFVPGYILSVVRHPLKHAAEWALLGMVLVWSLGQGMLVLIFKPSRNQEETG